MPPRKTIALVLRKYPVRETSLIAVMFSPDVGKFSGIFKGIRKDPKKFNSSVDLFSLNEIIFYPSRSSSLHLVSYASLIERLLSVQRVEEWRFAGRLMNLVERVSPVHQANKALFDVIVETLCLIGKMDNRWLEVVFDVKLLKSVGFRPYIDGCLVCQKKIVSGDIFWFGIGIGGMICDNCRRGDMELERVNETVINVIKMIDVLEFKKALNIKLPITIKQSVFDIVTQFVKMHCIS